jgi:hypothetical protein
MILKPKHKNVTLKAPYKLKKQFLKKVECQLLISRCGRWWPVDELRQQHVHTS